MFHCVSAYSISFFIQAQENARLPVAFIPDGPGHYQCRIVMKAPNDIRVYQIEVTTNPEGSDIELEFTSPTHESVTQNIPVVSMNHFVSS